MNDNVVANLHITMTDSMLSSISDKMAKEIGMLSPNRTRLNHLTTGYS